MCVGGVEEGLTRVRMGMEGYKYLYGDGGVQIFVWGWRGANICMGMEGCKYGGVRSGKYVPLADWPGLGTASPCGLARPLPRTVEERDTIGG